MERIAHEVARDIRNQYTIQYSPDEPGDGRHVPADQGRGERARPADRAHAQRLLRDRKGRTATVQERIASSRNAPHSVAPHPRLPAAAVAEPVFAVAYRNVLGAARGGDHVPAVLGVRRGGSGGTWRGTFAGRVMGRR